MAQVCKQLFWVHPEKKRGGKKKKKKGDEKNKHQQKQPNQNNGCEARAWYGDEKVNSATGSGSRLTHTNTHTALC